MGSRCGEWCPYERDFFPPGAGTQGWGGDGLRQAVQTFLEMQPNPCPSLRTRGFWWLYEFQAEAPAVQGFSCPDSICFSLVIQGHKAMQVPAKCKFGFCLIMTSLS